ncbi:MAG TPA: hypothetical protein VFF31_14225 [Blastocatellia bacterium]|nr:hypothetical protein [Blastocatellia bacterium]
MLSKAYELVAQVDKQPLGIEPAYYLCTNLLIQWRGNELLIGISQPRRALQGFNNDFIDSSASHGTPDDAVNLTSHQINSPAAKKRAAFSQLKFVSDDDGACVHRSGASAWRRWQRNLQTANSAIRFRRFQPRVLGFNYAWAFYYR